MPLLFVHTASVELPPPLDEALARALTAPAAYRKTLATDADGTLWEGDVGDALFLSAARSDRLTPGGLRRLRAHANFWGITDSEHASAGTLADALFALVHDGTIDVQAQCDLEADVLGDRSIEDLDALCSELGRSFVAAVRPGVRALLNAAKARGLTVCVVSGSLDRVVEATLRAAELPFDHVVGANLAASTDTRQLAARLSRPSPVFDGKTRALEALGLGPPAIALGDSGFDAPLLMAAHAAVLVHPKPALVDATQSHAWRAIVHDAAHRSTT